MALYEKKVSCPKCGVAFTILVPRGMSSFGIEAISICDSCKDGSYTFTSAHLKNVEILGKQDECV